MIKLASLLDPPARAARKQYEQQVEGVVTQSASRIARARFSLSGGRDYPDATFTLRISYGQIKGYTNAAGQPVAWDTDFAGMYRKETGRDPYILPERWFKARTAVDLTTPFDFAATADIHGGNSGSATLNSSGDIVGIVFDSNIEALPNRFIYAERQERSVHVATQGIVEALKHVYGASSLLRELGF
jgi:hypothetical protein